jgi:hypothetical protein
METISNVASLLFGLTGFASGLVLWYRSSVQKSYAAERDFGHLRNNYKQLADSLTELNDLVGAQGDRQDRALTELERLRSQLNDIDRVLTEIKIHLSIGRQPHEL